MKYTAYPLTFLILLLLSGSLFAQQKIKHSDHPIAPGPDGIVRCASMEVDAIRRLNNPNIGTLEDFEEWLAPKVREYEQQIAEGRNTVVITIPLVVHVLHNGEPVGTAPNITDAQVLSQVQVLNEDFRKIFGTNGWNEHPDGADVELEFCPATVDPYGNQTNGVNRVNVGMDGVTRDDLEGSIKASTIWDPNQYMNMWSVKFGGDDDNLLGYAQFPEGSGLPGMPASGEDPTTDGVVIRYQSFGTSDLDDGTFILEEPYDLGRTATHEVGHWVGLRHIWGDGLGCNLGVAPPGCSCLQDDYCEDTPNSESANYGCPEGKLSFCEAPPTLDMIENYMDYSDDPCMNIFTNDQKSRVQAVMANSPRRKELVNSGGCAAPRPAIAFAGVNANLTEGSSCGTKSLDIAVNISQAPSAAATVALNIGGSATQGQGADFTVSPSSLTFPAGSTASQHITITISEDAVVEADEFISLQIGQVTTSGNAVAARTNQHFIVNIEDDDVSPEQAGNVNHSLIFTEDFNLLGLDWTVTAGPGSAVKWRVGAPPLGLGGDYNAYISLEDVPGNLYLYNPYAYGYSRIESPVIDASNTRNLSLSFKYTCMGESGYDFGTLWYSRNGGAWKQFGPAEFATQPIPVTVTVPLPEDANNSSSLRLAFQWENDELLGDNPPFSFDNIELRATTGAPAAVQTEVNTSQTDGVDLGPLATVHFYDPASGRIMATVQNTSSYDYGCTTLEVDRSNSSSGAAAVAFWNNDPANALAAKSFRLLTENDNPPSGSTLQVTVFYTKAEITAWEAATLQSRNDLQMIGVAGEAIGSVTPGGDDDNIEVDNATLASFTNAAFTVTAVLDGKTSGVGIGVPGLPSNQQSLGWTGNGIAGAAPFGADLQMAISPNPATGKLNVTFPYEAEAQVELQLINRLGQIVSVPVTVQDDRAEIILSGVPDGVYFVKMKRQDKTLTRKVVVRQ